MSCTCDCEACGDCIQKIDIRIEERKLEEAAARQDRILRAIQEQESTS